MHRAVTWAATAAVVLAAPASRAQPAASATVTLRGRVVDRATGAPVAGAIATVGGELVATDDDGRFTVALSRGRHQLAISAPWLVARTIAITLTADRDLRVEVDSADEVGGETIEVIDIAPSQIGQTQIDAALARAVPGGGDAAKVVQSLPAVARPPAGSAEIVVWGAAPRDTRVFVDSVPVPALYHLGGYRAAVGNDLLGDVRLTPAAFGPDRGRAIGGVIDIGLADPSTLPAVRAQVDVLDAGAAARLTLADDVAVVVAIRHSHLDRAVDLVTDPGELAPNIPLPRWSDGQLALRARLADDLVLSGWVMGSLDALDRTLASDDPATETTQRTDLAWLRAQVTLQRDRPGRSESATLWFGRDHTDDELEVGLVAADLHVRQWVGGARVAQRARLADALSLALGADLDGERAHLQRAGSLTIPAREGDLQIFGQPPGDDRSADRWSATTLDLAGHAAVELALSRVTASVGGRLDGWLLGASRLTPRVGTTPGIGSQHIELTIDPRASVQVALGGGAAIRVDAGRYHQARAATDTSAVFGTPSLGLERAWHVTLGGQWRRPPFAIEAAGYARRLDDLVARDLAVTPRLAAALTQAGTGTVVGVQITMRVVGWRGLSGWLSYGLSRSRRRDDPAQPERFFDRDQTHGLIAVGGWERACWTVGARVRLATGEPRTDVLGAFFDARSGRFQPIRGEHNGVRLPLFVAADLRAERRFAIGATQVAVYAELQNLTGRANAEEIVYSADFSERAYLTGLPLLALVGVRLER